jgi:hypothetical protein
MRYHWLLLLLLRCRHLLLLLHEWHLLLLLLKLQLLQLLRRKQLLLVLVLLPLSLQLLQSQRLLQLLRSTHAQHLNPVHCTHRLTAVVRVKREQQVAHPAALRQREGLRASLVLRSEAAQQLPGL